MANRQERRRDFALGRRARFRMAYQTGVAGSTAQRTVLVLSDGDDLPGPHDDLCVLNGRLYAVVDVDPDSRKVALFPWVHPVMFSGSVQWMPRPVSMSEIWGKRA